MIECFHQVVDTKLPIKTKRMAVFIDISARSNIYTVVYIVWEANNLKSPENETNIRRLLTDTR
jgi:hypothetical protein